MVLLFGSLRRGNTVVRSSCARRLLANSANVKTKPHLATIRLYRLLQRTVRSFDVENFHDPILLQPPLEATHWGRHMMFYLPDLSPHAQVEELYRLFYFWNENDDFDDWYYTVIGKSGTELPPMTSETCWTTQQALKQAIRNAFKMKYDVDSTTLTKWAIRAVQTLEGQKIMWENSSCETTENVRVTATSRCIGTSNPIAHFPPAAAPSEMQPKHRFAYRIRIENLSDQHVQLIGRYWYIEESEDDSNEPVVVDAPTTGVVGQCPVLRPSQAFEYMSGTDLRQDKGMMRGHFYMAKVSEGAISLNSGDKVEVSQADKFEASVAPFPLVAK